MDLPTEAKGYLLLSKDKLERALSGSPNRNGVYVGGVIKGDGTYDEDQLLAEYDRLGGLIRKGEDKVKTGSFYDFANRSPRAKAEVKLEFRINGRLVEVSADEPLPTIVRASKELDEIEKEEKKKARGKRS